MSTPPRLDPRVYVSWDGSGDYTGPYDDVTADTVADPGLTFDVGRDAARTLAPPKVSAGTLELFNDDGTYSQHRPDSPLYQRVLPGRPIRVTATAGTAGAYDEPAPYDAPEYYDGKATWQLTEQLVDEIAQETAWGARRVRFSTLGREVVLTDSIVTVPLQANIRTDQAVALVLDACGWPADRRQISVGDTTLLYWWADEERPWDTLLAILGAEGPGTFYVDRDGDFHFENRNYRAVAARSMTAQATYRAVPTPGGLWFSDFRYDPAYAAIYNEAIYRTTRRAPAALATVWSFGAMFSLGPNLSYTLTAKSNDPFQNAQPLVLGTDYTIPGGSGTVTLLSTSGPSARIKVDAGPDGIAIMGPTADPSTGMQLRAEPIPVVSETTSRNAYFPNISIATYSPIPGMSIPIPLQVAGWPEIDPIAATAVCDAWVRRYEQPRPVITVTLRNVDVAHVAEIVGRRISDRVTLIEPQTGYEDDVWINAASATIAGPGGSDLALVLGCETCDTLVGVLWDTAVWDDPGSVWGI